MKKLYFSMFLKGMERPIEAMLRHEGGVSVERIYPGLAIYRSVREMEMPFLQRTFLLLHQMKPEKDLNAAVRRMSETDVWLDRFPFEETEGKRFRIVTAEDGQPSACNMRYIAMIEKNICEQTGMRVSRERPEVELWISRRPEATYFLWRLSRRDMKSEDPLRRDLCEILAFLTQPQGKEAVVLGATGQNLPEAFRSQGASRIMYAKSRSDAAAMKLPGKALDGTAGFTGLDAGSQSVVSLCIPPRGSQALAQQDIRGALREALRILKQDGLLVVLCPEKYRQETAKLKSCDILVSYSIVLSGENCRISLVRGQGSQTDDAYGEEA